MKPVSRNVKKWLTITGLAALNVAICAALGFDPLVALCIGACLMFLAAPL